MPDRTKVYLETSVISYLAARPSADPEKAAVALCNLSTFQLFNCRKAGFRRLAA